MLKPVFNKVLEGIKADLMTRFATSQPSEMEQREICYQELNAINELQRKFRAVLTAHDLNRDK